MEKLNLASIEEIVEDIISKDDSESCYFSLDKPLFQRLSFGGKLYLLSEGLLQKRKLPVRVVVKFHGPLMLHHLTREAYVDKIRSEGFLSERYDPTNFDLRVNGLYCIRADCPHGFKAMQYVLNDYPDLTHIVTFKYSGDYYLTVNHLEEYIIVTSTVAASDIISIEPIQHLKE